MTAWPDLLAAVPAASPFAFALSERRWLCLDLSSGNAALRDVDPADAAAFGDWVRRQCAAVGADCAAGGYAEDRALYRMSPVFAPAGGEARTVHLGMDLWLPAGTPVHAVVDGVVHGVRDNAAFGDYGPTVVLEHHAGGRRFYTLYGHLARRTLDEVRMGQRLRAGERLGWLGDASVNGGWPPHLHFQVIDDMRGLVGDHPGVCTPGTASLWLARCPDPDRLLRIPFAR